MLLISTISIIIYIIAGVMIYHNIYNYDKLSKIKLITIGFILTLIVTVIMCFISTSQISVDVEATNNQDIYFLNPNMDGVNSKHISIIRNITILIFSPINAIISLPYIYNTLNKYKDKKIDKGRIKKENFDIFYNLDSYIYI